MVTNYEWINSKKATQLHWLYSIVLLTSLPHNRHIPLCPLVSYITSLSVTIDIQSTYKCQLNPNWINHKQNKTKQNMKLKWNYRRITPRKIDQIAIEEKGETISPIFTNQKRVGKALVVRLPRETSSKKKIKKKTRDYWT